MIVVVANTEHKFRQYLKENKARWEGKSIRRVSKRQHLHGYHVRQVIDITHSHHHYSTGQWEEYMAIKEMAIARCEQWWMHRGDHIKYNFEYKLMTPLGDTIKVEFSASNDPTKMLIKRVGHRGWVEIDKVYAFEQLYVPDLLPLFRNKCVGLLGRDKPKPKPKHKNILSKLERKLERLKERQSHEDAKYKGNEMKLTFHAGFDSGYTKGRISLLEDIIDDLKESGHEG